MDIGKTFEDAQALSKEHENFEAPTLEDLADVKVGDTVKVCMSPERFWAEITKVDGEKLEARVDNNLFHGDEFGFDFNDTIKFEKRNIYSVFG